MLPNESICIIACFVWVYELCKNVHFVSSLSGILSVSYFVFVLCIHL